MTDQVGGDRPLDGCLADGRKFLFIASEARSGSTFVSETLAYELNAAQGYALWELSQEPFQQLDESSTPQHVLSILDRLHVDPCGFAGAKLLCRHLSQIWRLAALSPAVREAFFGPRAYWVVVRRADRIAQAVSLAAARNSGVYHHYEADPAAPDEPAPAHEEIQAALHAIALSDFYLDLWSGQVSPERRASLVYEDFVVDQVGALQIIHELCGFPRVEAGRYRNQAKLKRAGTDVKRRAAEAYKSWMLANYV